MQKIALPKNVKIEKIEDSNRARIIIDPCFPGYGITLGNAIRRVLLSSLEGAATVGVKIKDVDHEFMALPHVKEDILEFILNLKQIRFKLHAEDEVKLELEVHGIKEVKAGDIKKNSAIEIVNPDLTLCNITDMAGNLFAEIFVKKGMGYEMIESRENKSKEIGYIEIDSIFSPILSVGIKTENVRVGKMTNWDRLILDILTDGSITPEEAFKDSISILIEQFGALDLTKTKEVENSEVEKVETEDDVEDSGDEEDDESGDKKRRGRPKKA